MTKYAAFLNSAERARLGELSHAIEDAQRERARIMGRIRQRALRLATSTETRKGD